MTQEDAGTFVVRQEHDTIASARLAKIAILALGIGLLGVFFSGVVLETNTGGIRANEARGKTPRDAGRTISNIEQTPILGPAEGLDLQRRQREQLSRYRWVDRPAGIAAIPIERAMDLVAKGAR